jgi:hypothetical protein
MTPAALRDVAQRAGPVPALAVLYAETGPDVLHCGPRGHAVAPAAILKEAVHVCIDGSLRDRAPDTEQPFALPGWLGGVDAVRLFTGGKPCAAFRTGLTWLRFGLSRGLLDTTVAYLRSRTVAGGPVLHQQLVKGALADVLVELLAIEAALDSDPTGAALRELHDQITGTDRMLLRLLGARGFVTDGPAPGVHLSELLADAYVPAEDAQ